MERAVEWFAFVQFVIVGVSHLAQPRAWVDFFTALRDKGHAGVVAVGLHSLTVGSVVVAFHPVWAGPGVALTLFGWAQVLKGALYLCVPALGVRSLGRVSPERAHEFRVAGLVLLLFAGVTLWALAV